jgi:hypothetical protein
MEKKKKPPALARSSAVPRPQCAVGTESTSLPHDAKARPHLLRLASRIGLAVVDTTYGRRCGRCGLLLLRGVLAGHGRGGCRLAGTWAAAGIASVLEGGLQGRRCI